ncbi:MAG TPA: hypothetical protein VFC19_16110 [Candidatus Limnocylindrales bacterium]|nr:hypothetical protein [Candidatus Limnocylindrales bacterium]
MGSATATRRLALIVATGMIALALPPLATHAVSVSFEAPCSDTPRVDVTPPSVPGNARYATESMTTLSWDPSTDDTGMVQYQVFHRTTQIATTT